MFKIGRIVVSIFLVSLIALACEGPSGPDGLQGPEGAEGPVGPAGEDGSMMYAGEGEPEDDIGDIDDYYLNQDTGELYGPKDEDGWGEPGVVLMGEDGQNGADGEDGSQIHSGNGEPDPELGTEGDFYLNEDEYDLYGPKTSNGWGMPLNLKGADGNANVTRYIFPGHDFEQDYRYILNIDGIVESEQEMRESAWLMYLTRGNSTYHHIPGDIPDVAGTHNSYAVSHEWNGVGIRTIIQLIDGNGDEYNGFELIRIETSSTDDRSKLADDNTIIPEDLDTSDYEAVAEYYGF